GRAEFRRENAAQDKAAAPACRKNPLRVRLLVSVQVRSGAPSGTRGIRLFIFSLLTRRCPWVVGLRGARREVENDLEPPVGLVSDLNGRAVQVSLRAEQDVECRPDACLLVRHIKMRFLEVAISLTEGAAVAAQGHVYLSFRDGVNTQQGDLVVAGVVYIAKRVGRRVASHRVIDQLQGRRQELPHPRTGAPRRAVQAADMARGVILQLLQSRFFRLRVLVYIKILGRRKRN